MGIAYSVANEPPPNNYKENVVWGTLLENKYLYRGSSRAHSDVLHTSPPTEAGVLVKKLRQITPLS
jgi:hypothetical protein